MGTVLKPRDRKERTTVLFMEHGPVAEIQLNRPEKRNAITPEMAKLVEQALDRFEHAPGLRVGVLSAAGTVAFCSGADLNYVAAGQGQLLSTRLGGFGGMVRYPRTKPLVAAVQGFALGGGFEIVLACDLIVAEASARFGLPEVTRGIIANGGGLLRLPLVLSPAVALDLILTARSMDAQEALACGLISRVVSDGTARREALALATQIAERAPAAVLASLQVARASYAIANSLWDFSAAMADRVRSTEDAIQAAQDFLEQNGQESGG